MSSSQRCECCSKLKAKYLHPHCKQAYYCSALCWMLNSNIHNSNCLDCILYQQLNLFSMKHKDMLSMPPNEQIITINHSLIELNNTKIKYIINGYVGEFVIPPFIKYLISAHYTVSDIRYYKTIGIEPDSTQQQLQAVYHEKWREINTSNMIETLWPPLANAWDILGDPIIREIYDIFGTEGPRIYRIMTIFLRNDTVSVGKNKSQSLIEFNNKEIRWIVFGYIRLYQYFILNKQIPQLIKDICFAYYTVCDITYYKHLEIEPDDVTTQSVEKLYHKKTKDINSLQWEYYRSITKKQRDELNVKQNHMNEAYEILKDPTKREIYDEFGLKGLELYDKMPNVTKIDFYWQ